MKKSKSNKKIHVFDMRFGVEVVLPEDENPDKAVNKAVDKLFRRLWLVRFVARLMGFEIEADVGLEPGVDF